MTRVWMGPEINWWRTERRLLGACCQLHCHSDLVPPICISSWKLNPFDSRDGQLPKGIAVPKSKKFWEFLTLNMRVATMKFIGGTTSLWRDNCKLEAAARAGDIMSWTKCSPSHWLHALLVSNYNNFTGLHQILWRLFDNYWLCVRMSSTSLVPKLRPGEPEDEVELYVRASVSRQANAWGLRRLPNRPAYGPGISPYIDRHIGLSVTVHGLENACG